MYASNLASCASLRVGVSHRMPIKQMYSVNVPKRSSVCINGEQAYNVPRVKMWNDVTNDGFRRLLLFAVCLIVHFLYLHEFFYRKREASCENKLWDNGLRESGRKDDWSGESSRRYGVRFPLYSPGVARLIISAILLYKLPLLLIHFTNRSLRWFFDGKPTFH